jgi:hypothetical protein
MWSFLRDLVAWMVPGLPAYLKVAIAILTLVAALISCVST